MAFSAVSKKNGKEYFLHTTLSANGKSNMYYFSKEVNPDKALSALPEGLEVSEAGTSGLPVVRKIKTVEVTE